MLRLSIPSGEYFDEEKQEFCYAEDTVILLEHSLYSVKKWEARWKKPFLSKEKKTKEELIDYVKCMTLTKDVKKDVYDSITNYHLDQVSAYINEPMTATTFREDKTQRRSREIVTAEIIYYWMVALQIPFECQYWHLNQLLTLIRVCNIKNQPAKKGNSRDDLARRSKLNAERRKRLGTTG